MLLSSPCQRRCRSNPNWYGTARPGGMSRSQNLNGRECLVGSSLSVEKARPRSCGADSSATRFLSVRHRHQQQGPGFPLFDVKSPPSQSISGLPHGTETFTMLLALRCLADAPTAVKSAANSTSCGCWSRGRRATAHARGETSNTESPAFSPPVLATREDQRPISTMLLNMVRA